MRRLIIIIGVFTLMYNVSAQNGFESTPLDFNATSYAIDFNGDYWFTDSEKIYKYDGNIISTYDTSNTNIDFNMIKNIWPYNDFLYIVTGTNVYGFNPLIPNSSYDLGLDKTISRTFFDGENLAVVSLISVGYLGIEVFDGTTWSEIDTLPEFASIQNMAFYQGSLYLALKNVGVYEYSNGEFSFITDQQIFDLIVWDGKLWMTDGDSFGIWEDNSYKQWIMQAGVNGARHFQIIDDQLWAGSFNRLFQLSHDHISAYETNDDVHIFPNYGSTTEIVQYVYSDRLITFNESDYISNLGFHSLENKVVTSINNVEAMFSVFGSFFWDLQGNPHYYVPKTGNTSSLFASAIWMAGKDEENVVHAAYEEYVANGPRYTPGPLNLNLETSEEVREKFNKIWHIDRATIENFKYRYEIGDVFNGDWPIDYFIKTWPAHGSEGYAANIAPFVDVNGDGEYSPLDGDYPRMKGDEMLYWVANDNNHNISGFDNARNVGVEMHFTVWSNRYENPITGGLEYVNDTTELINNTIFMDVDIINRSENIYHDFYVGLWSDGDMGYAFDDYIGMDVMNHSYYYYNGDANDNSDPSPSGYGNYPPAQSITFLDVPYAHSIAAVDTSCNITKFISYERNEELNGIPTNFSDYYNYLSGKWKDSISITWGGFGRDSSDVACNYMYPGNSDIYNIGTNGVEMGEWSEISANHLPNDRSGIASNGPLVFSPGDTLSYRFAFSFVRDENSTFPYSVDKLQQMLPVLHKWQRTGEFPSSYDIEIVPTGIRLNENNNWEVKIYPNPAKDNLIINSRIPNYQYRIIDLGGQELMAGKVSESVASININDLHNGMYIIVLYGKGEIVSKKLVVY